MTPFDLILNWYQGAYFWLVAGSNKENSMAHESDSRVLQKLNQFVSTYSVFSMFLGLAVLAGSTL
jgi:hypothetical protein